MIVLGHHLVKEYIRAVAPYRDNKFVLWGQWSATHEKLTLRDIRDHLQRSEVYGVSWQLDHEYDFAVIDLDNSEEPAYLWERYMKVWRALRGLPHVVIWSSASFGLHVYIFFKRKHPGDHVRNILSAALVAQGLTIKNGHCEVYPSNLNLRLPLGRGSALLRTFCTGSAISWEPAFLSGKGIHSRRHRNPFKQRITCVSVDKLSSLQELVCRSRQRISLDDIRPSTPRRQPRRSATTKSENPAGATTNKATSDSTAKPKKNRPKKNIQGQAEKTQKHISKIKKGITEEGQRYSEWALLVKHLVRYEGLLVDETVEYIEDWLHHGNHHSRTLGGPDRDSCIRKMIKDTYKRAASQLGKLPPGYTRTHGANCTPITALIVSLCSSTPPFERWKEKPCSYLQVTDMEAVEEVMTFYPCWSDIRPAVETFIGLIRMLHTKDDEVVHVPHTAMERIAGHRSKPMPRMTHGGKKTSQTDVAKLKFCLTFMRVITLVEAPARSKLRGHGKASGYRIRFPRASSVAPWRM